MRVDTVSFQKRQRFLSPKSQKNLKSIFYNSNPYCTQQLK